MEKTCFYNNRRLISAMVGCLLSSILPVAVRAQVVDCGAAGNNTPARPVPQCVDDEGFAVACSTPGAIRLWPDDFRPASTIPLKRDSTDRVGGIGVPGAQRGWELFKSVDIVATETASRLYVAYNAGIQVWDITTNPANPVILNFRDGWPSPDGFGHFLSFPPVSEQLAFIEDIVAINLDAETDLVAASGKIPVGPTIWHYDIDSATLTPKYQDVGTTARQTRLVQVTNGTVFLFAATDDGIAVYNATAANNLLDPCLDDEGSLCPAVYRGTVPGVLLGRYIDVIHNPSNDRVYVVTTDGNFLPLEIWELADPNFPVGAVRRLDAPGLVDGRGPALFSYEDHFYLAVEQDHQLKVFFVDECVDGSGCSMGAGSVELAMEPVALRDNPANTEFLSYSRGGGGVPFLYYGVSVGNLEGSDVDQLFDLRNLRPPGSGPLPQPIELTAGGGSYDDPCNGEAIRYWSHYYPRNYHGLRNFVPRIGKMSPDNFFYRAGNSILDVHRYDGPTDLPSLFTDGFESGDTSQWSETMGVSAPHKP